MSGIVKPIHSIRIVEFSGTCFILKESGGAAIHSRLLNREYALAI